ncbi:MAG: murein biosynthesis integral membrane protein MurJ, partial [Betaproteobacteria bacterium]|nr:murein biosynthesis integral membrane protein MurJ [Betaproteobacteria bacterium]
MNLLRAASTVSLWTLASRISGLLRESLTYSIFGVGAVTDAFNVAFRIPNLLRRLFAEGAFSQAFVPLLADAHARRTPEEQQRFLDAVATVQFWVLVVVTVIGVAGAPLLVMLLASGLRGGEGFADAVGMTRIMFPYILFMSLVAFAAGVLNTWRHFAVPAATPVLLNLCVVAAALWLAPHVHPPIYALAIGVLVGGVLQLALQWPALRRHAVVPRVRLGFLAAWRSDGVRRLLRQMLPATLAVSVAQLSLIVNTQIASYLAPGSITWLNQADRLMEFPTALIGVALGVVLIPNLTQAHSLGDRERYNGILD